MGSVAPGPPADGPPKVPPIVTNPPSGFLYCPSPLWNSQTLGGLSPCFLITTFPVLLLLATILIAFLPYFARILFRRDLRGQYQALEDDGGASDENGRGAGNGRVQITATTAEGVTVLPHAPEAATAVEIGAAAPSARFPIPVAPVPLFLTIVQYCLLTILAISLFEALYLAQHVFVPDASKPGPILRWTLTPVWTVVPWMVTVLIWTVVYAIWAIDFEEDVAVTTGSVTEKNRIVVPKYKFRWRYQGIHVIFFVAALVELYHRAQWVSRMDGIHGVFTGTWRGERMKELWGGVLTAMGKLGFGNIQLGDSASWMALAPTTKMKDGGDMEGMGGWTAVAGEDWSFLVTFGVRFVLLLTVLVLEFSAVYVCQYLKPGDPDAAVSEDDDDLLDDAGAKALKEVKEQMAKAPQTWDDFIQRFRKVLRFAWPDRWAGRASLIGCFILLVLGRIVNVNVPLTYKRVVDDLTNPTSTTLPYRSLFLFAGLKILQGGLLDAMSGLLWVPVAQHITKDVSVKLFQHLMSLSIRWHMLRKTGETIKIQSRGVTSIVDILNACLLQVAPIFLDIGLACTYFSTQFDSMFSLIVFSTMIIYIFASFKLTQLRVRHRKASNQLENKVSGKAVDALVNFESVKYFANERFEAKEYATAFDNYQAMEWQVSIMNSIANVIQVMIIQLGMLIGAIECARRIVEYRTYTVGDFVLFLTYVGQLYGPLGQLQRQYRTLQRAMIDLESMLELFETVPEVQDKPNAVALSCPAGQIDFDHITFAYDAGKTPVIKDFDAHVQAGHTVALVGTSGGGKSTTLRLLYRFMDVTGGAIRVDGQDIRDVTQDSLRKVIGVVPQDTALFNNTIRYNIRYGRLDATDQEVEEAAKAAQIYDRVMSFELGFDTIVGERGLRLSGGEKQRIAIARTILRRPKILFLDEATSALDTQTEKAIQEQLNQLSAGKTTLTIAHRLSTVINSDMILVLDQGRIIERGSFDELLALNGIFAGMWQAQLRDPLEDKQPKRDRSADPTPGLRSGRGVSLRRDGDSELDD